MDNEAAGKYITKQDEQIILSPVIHHAHAAGIMGGFAVCNSPGGIVTDDLNHVDCPECVRRINWSFNYRKAIGAIDPSPWLESTWERVSRGRIIGGQPPSQYKPLPESDHPGLSTAAFDALRAKFGRVA